MERKLLCQLFIATNCNTLARHALKLICQTTFDSILFKLLLSQAAQCLVVTSRRSCDQNADARSVVFVFIQINTFTYPRKCQSIKRTVCMLNFIYIVQSK